MDPRAVEQAAIKLAKAEAAIARLLSADNYQTAEDGWMDFLQAASTVYSKLEQGAKGAGKSRTWFGLKKKQRRDDPLLRYLHFARNAEEHGVEPVTERDPASGERALGFGKREDFIGEIRDASGTVVAKDLVVAMFGPTIRLVRAHDRRFGDFCDPPASHLGQRIQFHDLRPGEVGKLGLTYLRMLIDEARALSAPLAP